MPQRQRWSSPSRVHVPRQGRCSSDRWVSTSRHGVYRGAPRPPRMPPPQTQSQRRSVGDNTVAVVRPRRARPLRTASTCWEEASVRPMWQQVRSAKAATFSSPVGSCTRGARSRKNCRASSGEENVCFASAMAATSAAGPPPITAIFAVRSKSTGGAVFMSPGAARNPITVMRRGLLNEPQSAASSPRASASAIAPASTPARRSTTSTATRRAPDFLAYSDVCSSGLSWLTSQTNGCECMGSPWSWPPRRRERNGNHLDL